MESLNESFIQLLDYQKLGKIGVFYFMWRDLNRAPKPFVYFFSVYESIPSERVIFADSPLIPTKAVKVTYTLHYFLKAFAKML